MSLGLIKYSITYLIRRMFYAKGLWFIVATWAVILAIIAWTLYTCLIGFFICKAIASAWGAVAPVRCGNSTLVYAAVAVVDIVLDVIMVALPIKLVLQLQMSRPHKIGLSGVFGAGFM